MQPPESKQARLKCAVVKQCYDVTGAWASMKWAETDPLAFLSKWPYKASLWELSCLLQADWYVIPYVHDSEYIRTVALRSQERMKLFDQHVTCIVSPGEIPFEQYDLILSLDPILRPPQDMEVVFAYLMNEHANPDYQRSLHTPLPGYDLFLDHLLQAPEFVTSLPQAVAFPYPRDYETARRCFPGEKEEAVWLDARTVLGLARGSQSEVWNDACDTTLEELQPAFGLPVRSAGTIYRGEFDVGDTPRWGDAVSYLEGLAGCKYFVSLPTRGCGQSLCDAASLGAICFGSGEMSVHRLLCHPACLVDSLQGVSEKLRAVCASPELQEEILQWQDQRLRQHFMERPMQVFEVARRMKQRRHRGQVFLCFPGFIPSRDQTERKAPTVLPANSSPRAWALCERGVELFNLGRAEEALLHFQEAERLGAVQPGLHYAQALALAELSQLEDAVLQARLELAINHYNEETLRLLQNLGGAVEARLVGECKVRLDPRSLLVGGSWQGHVEDGQYWPGEMEALIAFYEKTLDYEQPVILDIGANTGTFSLLAAANRDIRGFAFEPALEIFDILNRNLALNGLQERIRTVGIALSDRTGTARLKIPRCGKRCGLSCIGTPLRFDDWVEVEIQTMKLDDFVQEENLDDVNLIKIDTEGCELLVLRGGEHFIREVQPDILTEYHPQNTRQFGYEAQEIRRLLHSWGYQGIRISPRDMFFYPVRRRDR